MSDTSDDAGTNGSADGLDALGSSAPGAGEGEGEGGSGGSPASGLAVISVLCGLGSFGACCVSGGLAYFVDQMFGLGMVAAPALGLLAIVIGVAAVIRIRRSREPMLGKPMAMAGILIGLIGVILQGAVVVGALLPFRAIQTEVVPVARFVVMQAHAGDVQRAKGALSEETFEVLGGDPSRVAMFGRAIESAVGVPSGASLEIGDLLAGRRLIEIAGERGVTIDPASITPSGGAAPMPRPVKVVGDRGRATMIVFLDEVALETSKQVLALDALLVVSEEDWIGATLLPDGPGAAMARALGMTLIETNGGGAGVEGGDGSVNPEGAGTP
ncbi:MAG: hypothetical protein ACTS3F_08165 [Phycisphaerales bacterium]